MVVFKPHQAQYETIFTMINLTNSAIDKIPDRFFHRHIDVFLKIPSLFFYQKRYSYHKFDGYNLHTFVSFLVDDVHQYCVLMKPVYNSFG